MKIIKKPTIVAVMVTMLLSNIPLWKANANEVDEPEKNMIKEYKNTYQLKKKDTEYKSSYIKNYTSISQDASQIINIPDKQLKKVINQTLGKGDSEDITKAELESICTLSYDTQDNSEVKIENLEGIQYCINLSTLSLSRNNINDISPLSELNCLDILILSENSISDISALSKFERVEILDLSKNNIEDITSLGKMTKLSHVIDLSENNISEISILPNVQYLSLENNNISKIKINENIEVIEDLNLSGNNIKSIKDISGLSKVNLHNLDLSANNISDVSGISDIFEPGRLWRLNLSKNNISNISDLSGLTKLPWLDLSDNSIIDITALANMNYDYPDEVNLNKNYLNLNDNKTKEVINTLIDRGYKVTYEEQKNNEESKFTDIAGHWAESTIKDFISKGYINGYEDGTFRPNNSITRAEFVSIVNSYFGLTKSSGKVFKDTENHWARYAIDVAVTNGVCNGKTATEFKPNDPITRQEASVMIASYKKITDRNYDKLRTFKDAHKVADWAKPGVEGTIEKGYMGGYSDSTFRPKNKITRAEAVATFSRIK